ncbi:dihydroxyacetone kinase [Pseudovirgaria hyperparasitica]|uniref:Dihydroxyacetone kinase n=1 Tax=Pseudovirgaria hyperparasitica TaxID=470096 RepID=A0A6A6W8W8_9PEZI|nr:dihydroxyacetone kinase [Pseudovirgaria hyperparasitica]KAF2759103.1 dihydroxyacetone kinase [Pseudovirgaria hyperparasitica]
MSSTKHFLNEPAKLVESALRAIARANPHVAHDSTNGIIYQRPYPTSSKPLVSLISGGGSGHEPSFAGFVGPSLLTASVAGSIFASPNADAVRKCILGRIERSAGVLVIVMNYTGDVLNFGRAEQEARKEGVRTEMVVVGDDVGVGREKGGKVGRRGIAGTCLVVKCAGAVAGMGASLEDTYAVAKRVAENIISIGASLSHVHVPGRDDAEEDSKDAEVHVEIGMGIHNEEGSETWAMGDALEQPKSERHLQGLPGLIGRMLDHLLSKDTDRNFLDITKDDKVVLFINNLGGVSVLELGGITDEVCQQLDTTWDIRPVRVITGTFMTSLNGLGFSITLLRVQETGLGEGKEMLDLLDVPVEAAGWSSGVRSRIWDERPQAVFDQDPDEDDDLQPSNFTTDPTLVRKALTSALNRLKAAEHDITNYDTIVGDGDCGHVLSFGASKVLEKVEKAKKDKLSDPYLLLSLVIEGVKKIDGTSGALYTIYLNAAAAALLELSASEKVSRSIEPRDWAAVLAGASKTLEKYTPARPGDRTLIDALWPFVEEMKSSGNVTNAAEKAREGAARTKGMKASLGRTVYVGGDGVQHVPDPGAHGLAEFFEGLADGMAQ